MYLILKYIYRQYNQGSANTTSCFCFIGIGRDICKMLVRCGAEVYAVSRTKEDLDSLVQEVSAVQRFPKVLSITFSRAIYRILVDKYSSKRHQPMFLLFVS